MLVEKGTRTASILDNVKTTDMMGGTAERVSDNLLHITVKKNPNKQTTNSV
jgi:hypothetical protein